MPTVSIISAWFNESILAPLFLNHYSYADKIYILYDLASTDDAINRLHDDPRVTVIPIGYPDGLDWEIKQARINELALTLDTDWIIAVDADEFIWPLGYESDVKGWLSEQRGTVVHSAMWTVYRHQDDKDIDPSIPPMYQRRHGSPLVGTSYGSPLYIKPCVAMSQAKVQWDCGCHGTLSNPNIVVSPEAMVGAHWCMADPTLAIPRRIGQKKRQGQNNLAKGLGVQNHHITEEEIRQECEAHLDDPQLF